MQSLLTQILEAGGEMNKIDVIEIEADNNGIFASEDIYEGEVIGFVPPEMIIF